MIAILLIENHLSFYKSISASSDSNGFDEIRERTALLEARAEVLRAVRIAVEQRPRLSFVRVYLPIPTIAEILPFVRDKTDNIRNRIAKEQADLMREGFLELHAQAQMREAYIEPFVTRIAVRLQQIPYLHLLQMAAKACCPVEQQQRVRLSLRYAEDFDSLSGKTRLVRGQQPFEIIKAVPAEGEQTRGPQPDEQRRGVEAHELFETLSSQNASPLVENYYHRCSACIISKMFLNYKVADKIFRFRLCPPMR